MVANGFVQIQREGGRNAGVVVGDSIFQILFDPPALLLGGIGRLGAQTGGADQDAEQCECFLHHWWCYTMFKVI